MHSALTLPGRVYISDMASPTALDAHSGRPAINADLQDVAHVVHEEFDERLDPRAVDECLAHVAAQFADATVRSFVPLLVRRYVRDELQARLVRA
jgi:hypothetical protein